MSLPMRLGGLGLLSAERMRPAAFWASWADALPMYTLDRSGFVDRPGWHQLRMGARPPLVASAEPGEWQHGWQYHASSPLEHHFRETVPSPVPRTRLICALTQELCECGSPFDVWGRHRAACPRSGRLRARAVGPERSLARVCREAGATVRCHVKLRDMNVAVSAQDERAIEVLASGLHLHLRGQLAVDVTMRCPLTAQGLASPGAAHINGAALLIARRDKELKYHELVAGNRCALVVVPVETGGRWSSEAVDFVSSLAGARALDAPPLLRGSSFLAWPLVEDARSVLWQLLGDLVLRHA